jgi:hypothetical protein
MDFFITRLFLTLSFEFDPTLPEALPIVALVHFLCVFLLNFTAYLYILTKFYKVICYSKMTFEWLPMINPYEWPFSYFQILAGPYFSFWSKLLPSIKTEKSSLEISGIVGLEALNAVLFFCLTFTNFLIVIILQAEKILSVANTL